MSRFTRQGGSELDREFNNLEQPGESPQAPTNSQLNSRNPSYSSNFYINSNYNSIPGSSNASISSLNNHNYNNNNYRNSSFPGSGALDSTTAVSNNNNNNNNNNGDGCSNNNMDSSTPLLNNNNNVNKSKPSLNTLSGVFIPVVLSIWGVILFLRFGFILGQAGLITTLALFSLGYLITSSTSLSLSAISSNGTVKGGGPYFLISRSLGPEFGASIGLIFYFGTVLNGAMSILGFVESLVSNFGIQNGSRWNFLPDYGWYLVLYASIVLMFCAGVCFVGSKMFARASLFLACLLAISTISIVASLLFRDEFSKPLKGIYFTGLSMDTLRDNLWPSFEEGFNFKACFAIIFPACTGILAGASMSGDLRSPSKSIPNGTLGGVGFTYLLYVGLGTLMAASIKRHTLKVDLAVMQDISIAPALVTVGVLSTTLFSGLGSLIGAAKILQAIAKDELLSVLSIFGYGRKKDDEPIYSIIFTWSLMQVVIIGVKDINEIASFVTMFSLLTFGVLNLACFLLRITGSVNFRPSFHYFNWRTAGFGMLLCFVTMFYVDQLIASLSCLIMSGLFLWIHLSAPAKAWGDVLQSLIYHQVRKYLLRLDSRKDHVKFWRPQILVLINSPQENYLLIKFMNDLKKGGLFVLGHVLKGDYASRIVDYKKQLPAWLRFIDIGKIKAFVELNIAQNERIGAQNLITSSGLGGMKPNIVVLGFYEKAKKQNNVIDEDSSGGSFDGDSAPRLTVTSSTWGKPSHYMRTEIPKSPLLRPFYSKGKGKSVGDQFNSDPICSELPAAAHQESAESSISIENWVGIIEDSLMLNKAVAIARNFESLEFLTDTSRPNPSYGSTNDESGAASSSIGNRNSVFNRMSNFVKEEYKRVSHFWRNSGRSGMDEECPLVYEQDNFELPSSALVGNTPKRYIDLWPIQMTSTLPGADYSYSFDTYTMVLQMGCILHMNSYWRANYILRVIVFVEDAEDCVEEEARVKMLLKGLRINAEVKMVWLKKRGSYGDSSEYNQQLKAYSSRQRSDFLQKQRSDSKQCESPESMTSDLSYVPPPPASVSSGKPKRAVRSRRSTLLMTTRIPPSLYVGGLTIKGSDEDLASLDTSFRDNINEMDEKPRQHPSSPVSSAPRPGRTRRANTIASSSSAPQKGGVYSPIDEVPDFFEASNYSASQRNSSEGRQSIGKSTTSKNNRNSRMEDSDEEMLEKENAPPNTSIFDQLDVLVQHRILNQLMRRHSPSYSTAVIFSTLPSPDPGTGYSQVKSVEYVEALDVLTTDLTSIVLVHGKGLTVTMSL